MTDPPSTCRTIRSWVKVPPLRPGSTSAKATDGRVVLTIGLRRWWSMILAMLFFQTKAKGNTTVWGHLQANMSSNAAPRSRWLRSRWCRVVTRPADDRSVEAKGAIAARIDDRRWPGSGDSHNLRTAGVARVRYEGTGSQSQADLFLVLCWTSIDDHGKYPQAMAEVVVSAGYMRQIPSDPFRAAGIGFRERRRRMCTAGPPRGYDGRPTINGNAMTRPVIALA